MAMAIIPSRCRFVYILLFFSLCLSIPSFASSEPPSPSPTSCSSFHFPDGKNFAYCTDLPVLSSFIHWNFDSSSRELQVAYRHSHVTPSTWVAWGINPKSKGMVGTQAIIAFQKSNGNMEVYASPITGYRTGMNPGNLSVQVSELSATYSHDDEITIFATIVLPENTTSVNQVWQDGPVNNGLPGMHKVSGPNVQSMTTLNLLSGLSKGSGAHRLRTIKNVHGILNTISWGVMMPLGIVIARHLRSFEPAGKAWFHLHRICQISASATGLAGFITGIILGNQSHGIKFTAHKYIGIFMIALAALQVVFAFARPKKDHKYRNLWSYSHYLVGYSVVGLGLINIYKGFNMLKPEKVWKNAYLGFFFALLAVVVILEIYQWIIISKRKKMEASEDNSTASIQDMA